LKGRPYYTLSLKKTHINSSGSGSAHVILTYSVPQISEANVQTTVATPSSTTANKKI